MAESGAKASQTHGASAASSEPRKLSKPTNPVWRMMGLPTFRPKLPSRNWIIFLSVVGSWTAAVIYDRREKKRIQDGWIRVVEHIAQEPLDTRQLPRKVTVFLSAPPADGLVPARDHFHEYVKPILVAAALDWDAIEGRREGDIRAGLAERIRKLRKKRGEASTTPIVEGVQEIIEATRQSAGISEWSGHGGDVVIGRHAWKEYVRGLHEGWLGPVDIPASLEDVDAAPESIPSAPGSTPEPPSQTSSPPSSTDSASAAAPSQVSSKQEGVKSREAAKDKKKKKNNNNKKQQPPAFITTAEYENSILSSTCPQALGPAAIIPLPHLLGFFNFPIRIYRFLNRRQVADEIGRETAAAILGAYRPFETVREAVLIHEDAGSGIQWEQQQLLAREEPDWHKTARARDEDDDRERVWLDGMMLDARIAERMRRFVLEANVEERAQQVKTADQKPWFSSLWSKENKKKKEKEKESIWEKFGDEQELS